MRNKTDRVDMPGSDEVSQTRLWQSFEALGVKLDTIESRLSLIARLEERVNSHETLLLRHDTKLDDHDLRLRKTEIRQADTNDREAVATMVKSIQTEVALFKTELDSLKTASSVNKGRDNLGKSICWWVFGILAAYIILIFKKGP